MKYLKITFPIMLAAVLCFTFINCNFGNRKEQIDTDEHTKNQEDWTELEYLEVDEAQPLKGFVPFMCERHNINHSMEFFSIALNKINTAEKVYDYSELEKNITEIAGRGHQAILRVYLDCPEEADGTPSYFWDKGIEKKYYTYEDGKTYYFPDYTNQKCIDYLEAFIKNFGEKYNGDSRIGFIFCGLIGHWGEWHNYYYEEENGDENMPSENQQIQLLKAFSVYFDKTFTLVRKPTTSELSKLKNIGFHDDSFTESTTGNKDYYFMSLLKSFNMTERWKTAPIGGEFRPENQETFLDGKKYQDYYQDYDECVKETHCSWLLFDYVFSSVLSESEKTVGWEASKKLGYDLTVKKVSAWIAEAKIHVSMEIENVGIAPFYYNWQPELVLKAKNGKVYNLNNSGVVFDNWDLPSINESAVSFSGEFNIPDGVAAEGASLCFIIKNPMEKGIPLKLSNASLNNDLEGYITLKDF